MNKKLFFVIMLLLALPDSRADYNSEAINLSVSEKDRLVKLLAKEMTLFQFDSVKKIKATNNQIYLRVISKTSLGRFCRKTEIPVRVNKSIKKLLTRSREFHYLALPENGICALKHDDYISTGRSLLSDFVISSVLNSSDQILAEISLELKNLEKRSMDLASINIVKKQGDVFFRMEWESKNSNKVINAFVDINSQGFQLLDFGLADRL